MIYVGVLCSDSQYLARLCRFLSTHGSKEISVFGFSDEAGVSEHLNNNRLDVLLSEHIGGIRERLPVSTLLLFLTESADIDVIDDIPAIPMYQKAELIYKAVLNHCAGREFSGKRTIKSSQQKAFVISVMGAAGGVGASTIAMACACDLAAFGKRTLYLNFERFPFIEDRLSAEGILTLSDIFYSIKSRQQSLSLKIESAIRHDPCGVSFFAPFAEPLDSDSATEEELALFLQALTGQDLFDVIVIDQNPSFTPAQLAVLTRSHMILGVSDGTPVANKKLEQLGKISRRLSETGANGDLLSKLCVVYNKFGSTARQSADLGDVETIASFPRYENAARRQIVDLVADKKIFSKLL